MIVINNFVNKLKVQGPKKCLIILSNINTNPVIKFILINNLTSLSFLVMYHLPLIWILSKASQSILVYQFLNKVITAAQGMDQVSYPNDQVKHRVYPLLDAKS